MKSPLQGIDTHLGLGCCNAWTVRRVRTYGVDNMGYICNTEDGSDTVLHCGGTPNAGVDGKMEQDQKCCEAVFK